MEETKNFVTTFGLILQKKFLGFSSPLNNTQSLKFYDEKESSLTKYYRTRSKLTAF